MYKKHLIIILVILIVVSISFWYVKQEQKQNSDRSFLENVGKQIGEIEKEKESRTPAQQKIDSNLLYIIKASRGEPIPGGMQIDTRSIDTQGKVRVEISAIVTNVLLQKIKDSDGEIESSYPEYRVIYAHIPLGKLEFIAGLPDVKFIRIPIPPVTN